MPMQPELLYRQLGTLMASRPQFDAVEALGQEDFRWLARVNALVEESGNLMDAAGFHAAMDRMHHPLSRRSALNTIDAVMFRTLARLELLVPAQVQGAFINPGEGYTAHTAIAKVFSTAQRDVLIVDPYLDAIAVADFVSLVANEVSVRLLCDSHYPVLNASLGAALRRYREQYGAARPIDARATTPRALHDRLVLIDDHEAWVLTQSLKDFGARAPASIVRSEAELAALKVGAYAEIWRAANAL